MSGAKPMSPPDKSRWKADRQRRRSEARHRRALRDELDCAARQEILVEIDLGEVAVLAGLEVYWGAHFPKAYGFETSIDGETWLHCCRTSYGEGGQDVFAFPAVAGRWLRLTCDEAGPQPAEIVEINLYGMMDAAAVLEQRRVVALGFAPITLPEGESITVDLRRMRAPLGALIAWGETHGVDFSVHLSDDGETFREVGRITTGDGDSDSFWWRSTTARFFRLTVLKASAPGGAVIDELKLRVLNKDRMPIGEIGAGRAERRGDLYPQSLLGRQVYWTAVGGFDHEGEALFDEFGNLEPMRGSGQMRPSCASAASCTARPQARHPAIARRRLAADPDGRLVGGRRRTPRNRARARRRSARRIPDREQGARPAQGGARACRAAGADQSLLAAWRPCHRRRHRLPPQDAIRQRQAVRRILG